VSEGHPDKVCDRISDEIVDLFIDADPDARVAAETLTTTNKIVIAGEVRGPASITSERIEQAARDAVRSIGYEQEGFHWQKADVDVLLHKQSSDIAMGVDRDGAGDQGIMFGYACSETEELMPAPILYAHRVLRLMAEARHAGTVSELLPDAKSQFTVRYVNGKPEAITTVVVSTQHVEGLSSEDVAEIVKPFIAKAVPAGWLTDETKYYINPTGKFVIGGPDGDAGLTGRKIIVDTYGGAAPHGGGAFSGKDPTKVDRSAAYAARYLAKNIVAAGLATKCTIQLAYAIGVAKPLAIYVDAGGTGNVDETALEKTLMDIDLSPRGIRNLLGLARPIYAPSAAYGHFGRNAETNGAFSWERIDLAERLKSHLA
jgi:S-adenosylmethionine synthetase